MKKGFTLVELLAIVILLAALFLVVYPKVTEIMQKEEEKLDDLNLDTIYSAADSYINNNDKTFIKTVGKEYCILLKTLDEENLLPFDASKYSDKAVRIRIGKSTNYHEIVNSKRVGTNNACKSS